MNIIKIFDKNTLTIKLKGKLDNRTAPELEEELKKELPAVTNLVLDFDELNYISSVGLRVIVSTQKIMKKQGKMVIENVNSFVMEVLDAARSVNNLTVKKA
jgi:anti-sigma B factor antagonist